MIFDGGPFVSTSSLDNLTVPQLLLDHSHPGRTPRSRERTWFVDDHTGISYNFEEVYSRVQGLAKALSFKYSIQENDAVCILSPNHIDYCIAIWAVHRLGGVVVPLNPGFTADELTHQLATSCPVLIITDVAAESIAIQACRDTGIPDGRIILFSKGPPIRTPFSSKVFLDDLIIEGNTHPHPFADRKLRPREARTKLAFLSFSSGTTGKPKAVAISHHAVVSVVLQLAAFDRLGDSTHDVSNHRRRFRPGDVASAVIPFFHIYGLVFNLFFVLYSEMTVVVTPKFHFEDMLKNIVRYRMTHLLLVPPQIVLFCKRPYVKEYDLSSVRYVVTGAAPASPELIRQFQMILPNSEIGQGFGLTEFLTVTLYPSSQRIGIPGSVGRLLPGVQAKILKDDGTLGGYNERGELFVKGPQMSLGYLNNAEATRQTFVDGWVRTGDDVVIDQNGDVFILDRIKEIFKVRGFQVAPAELEGRILDHPDVCDVGVIGIPDEFNGNVPLAFVALKATSASRVKVNPLEGERIKADIIKHVADTKAQYKWLAGGVEFIDAIPMSPSGKILRRVLREYAKDLLYTRRFTARQNPAHSVAVL